MISPKVVSLIVANKPQAVVLIHGLHQNDWVMKPLAYRLKKLGFCPYLYRYHSLSDTLSTHSKHLHRFIKHANLQKTHLVAHSLGGLVVRQFLHDYSCDSIGRVVTLGTPHLGSIVAHYVHQLCPPLVGRSYQNALDGNLLDRTPNIQLGAIAGHKAIGLGQPILAYHRKKHSLADSRHDGTVFVFETQLSWAKDHITLDVSHTGMLVDKTVALQAGHFLTHGIFWHR